MPEAHDPAALVRHAAHADDWRLVYLITRLLNGRAPAHSPARRAYATLLLKLGLADDLGNYYHA
jgi:hypothetical protein